MVVRWAGTKRKELRTRTMEVQLVLRRMKKVRMNSHCFPSFESLMVLHSWSMEPRARAQSCSHWVLRSWKRASMVAMRVAGRS